jgi:hypothetical protein
MWRVKDCAESGFGADAPEVAVVDEQALRSHLRGLAHLDPRVVGIEFSASACLQVGLGGPWAFVEHIIDDPWKAEVALSRSASGQKPESVWYTCGGQGSEIPAQYLMPVAEAIDVVAESLRLGGPAPGWQWELS